MALSNASSIFANDSYSPQEYVAADPLTNSVGRTSLVDPGKLAQPSNTPTASTVEPTTKGASNTSGISGNEAKGAVKGAIAAIKFGIDLNNARTAYRATTAQIRNNITLSQINEADTISRGRQAMLERRVEGEENSSAALMHLAAQGLDVNSPGAQNLIKSYEAMGIYNAMREESNMYREAFKFDVEQAQYEFAQDMADINYDTQRFNATLDFATGMLDAGATAYGDKSFA